MAANDRKDPLNFSRTALAQQILLGFEERLQVSVTLFAPRRKGKTQFILQDLKPMAEERGFLVAYADLWSMQESPEGAICAALAEALNEADLAARLKAWWSRPKRNVKSAKGGLNIGASELGANGEIEMAEPIASGIHDLYERFRIAGRGKAILIVDEVQHLATKPTFDTFCAAFRALLNASQYEVFAVFTGSSQDGLTSMFKRNKAPFYQYGTQLKFPELGRELAEHFGVLYQSRTGDAWDVNLAFDRYVARGMMPAYLRQLYVKCLTEGRSIAEADREVWESMIDIGQFEAILDDLSPLDHFLLRRILTSSPLYSDEARQQAAQEVGLLVPPSTAQIQACLERMRRRDLVANLAHGDWIIEEDALATFLGNHYLNNTH